MKTMKRKGCGDSTRPVRTELNYIQNKAALESIKDAEMQYYTFMATLDKRTSTTCRNHDGHVYSVDDASPGTNMPPLHPRCRSTIAGSLHGPGGKQAGTRIARGDKGKSYHVPSSMTYKDWEAAYIEEKSATVGKGNYSV